MSFLFDFCFRFISDLRTVCSLQAAFLLYSVSLIVVGFYVSRFCSKSHLVAGHSDCFQCLVTFEPLWQQQAVGTGFLTQSESSSHHICMFASRVSLALGGAKSRRSAVVARATAAARSIPALEPQGQSDNFPKSSVESESTTETSPFELRGTRWSCRSETHAAGLQRFVLPLGVPCNLQKLGSFSAIFRIEKKPGTTLL